MALYKSTARQRFFLLCLLVLSLSVLGLAYLFFARKDSLAMASLHNILSWGIQFIKESGDIFLLLYIAIVAILLFFENKNPDKTIAWLLVLIFLPVVGLILYWVVGPNFRYLAERKRIKLQHKQVSRSVNKAEGFTPSKLVEGVSSVIYSCSAYESSTHNNFELLSDTELTYTRMFDAFEQAKKSICIESYIVRSDEVGQRLLDILVRKGQEGVLVYFLFDAVGSWTIGSRYVKSLEKAGVSVHSFLPVAFPMFRAANYRNHRKIAIVDGSLAFTGGINFGDEYLGKGFEDGIWRDTHCCFTGPCLASIKKVFLQDLQICKVPQESIEQLVASWEEDAGAYFLEPEIKDVAMQVAVSGPDSPWDTIKQAYITMISRAQKRIWITTPYLIPGDSLLSAMSAAALSGVDVRILIPAKPDHLLVYWASMHCCESLLRAGVRVFLYDAKSFVHAKTISADEEVYSVGSANLDTRSLQINFELQAFVYDASVAKQGDEVFLADCARATELILESWLQRSIFTRFKENIGKLFSSLA